MRRFLLKMLHYCTKMLTLLRFFAISACRNLFTFLRFLHFFRAFFGIALFACVEASEIKQKANQKFRFLALLRKLRSTLLRTSHEEETKSNSFRLGREGEVHVATT